MTVAALFVQKGGAYYGLEGVDPWDQDRDARLYAGPWPVVAHPPCAAWSALRFVRKACFGLEPLEDDGCFASALASVRRWGGVLEHPANSAAWLHHGLPHPNPGGGWCRDLTGGWSCEVMQGNYGHRAGKPTWLYAVGVELPTLAWGPPPAACEGVLVARMGSKITIKTPPPFRDLLLSIARSARRSTEAA